MTEQEEENKGAVVWLDLSTKGYAWWPCKVEEDCYVSFQDDCKFDVESVKDSRVRSYNHQDLSSMVTKGKRKLRKKKDTLQEYDKAVEQAVDYIKSNIDNNFQLNLEPNGSVVDVSTTTSRSEQTFISEISPQQYPLNGQKRDRQGNILGLKNCGSEEEDLVRWGEASHEDEILHGNERQQKKPKHSSSFRTDRNSSPLLTETLRNSTAVEGVASPHSPYQTPSPANSTGKTPPPTQPLHQLPVTPTLASSTPALVASTPTDVMSGCATIPATTSSSHFTAAACPPMPEIDSEDEWRILGSASESDDDLPAIDLSVRDSVNLYELRPRSVVWAKCGRWPFWPALVSKVIQPREKRKKKKRKTATVSLYFFGYNEKMHLKINNKKNIALFGYKNTLEYIKEGACLKKDKDQFDQAVKEARDLVRDMAEGLYKSIHSPKEVFRKAISNRPMDYNSDLPVYNLSGMEDSEEEDDEEEEHVPALLLSEGCSSEEEYVEEEKEKALYSYEQVKTEIRSLHPLLEDIAWGRVSSAFHNIVMCGTKKQQSGLKYGAKFGPILKGWQDEEKIRLLDEELLVIAKKVGFDFSYAYDVLLPEAMIRLIARFDGISYNDAMEKFYC